MEAGGEVRETEAETRELEIASGNSCHGEAEKKTKSERLWKKVKYQLVDYHSLPGYLKDNEYILHYYRSEWPLKQIFLSIFSVHNETLNVWTHLIGFFIFLALTIYTAKQIPKVVDMADLHKLKMELLSFLPSLPHVYDLHRLKDDLMTAFPSTGRHFLALLSRSHAHNATHLSSIRKLEENLAGLETGSQPISRWPFFAFLGGAMFCLLASSACHLFSCHSRKMAYIMLRLDYAGIAALIATSFYPPVYYSFLCNPGFRLLYLSSITLLGGATAAVSLLPVFQNPEFRALRAGLFFGMGVSGVVPVAHKMVVFWDTPAALRTAEYEAVMGLLYGLGALLYATRVPERWRPGWFDVAGHSHQIFHVLVVAAACVHYRAGLVYLRWRDLQGCS